MSSERQSPERARDGGQTMAQCGTTCGCTGSGCKATHPLNGQHCDRTGLFGTCKAGCTGTCTQGKGHVPFSAPHSCSHGHPF